ncbi:hypothetical protein CN481_04840 [Bacillus sp. AFS006103]|nr:hypothetical protein CN481_04840 [Bacillus sp. AFS006103]
MKLKIRLAGVTFGNRQDLLADTHSSQSIYLKRDYFNKYDRNATGVYNSGDEHLGWIPKEYAVQIAALIDAGENYSAKILRKLGGNGLHYGLEIQVIIDEQDQGMRTRRNLSSKTEDVKEAFQRAQMFFYEMHDFGQAAYWFKVCASSDSVAVAHYFLGFLHHHGLGVEKSYRLAKSYYRLGAEKGIAESAVSLGYLCLIGNEVMQDDCEALKWFHAAAGQELSDAYFNLAYMYEKGIGVSKDDSVAKKWLELAVDTGDSEAFDIFYGENDARFIAPRAPYHLLQVLSEYAKMKYYQNIFELYEQDIKDVDDGDKEQFDRMNNEKNMLQRYFLELQYYLKAEQVTRTARDHQRKLIIRQSIPNHRENIVDLFDASVLLDDWCDDMDQNNRKYLNAFRIDTMIRFLSTAFKKAVQTGLVEAYDWRYDFQNVLSRAMINLAVCYRNMNMFHDVPISIVSKGRELVQCATIICPMSNENPDFLNRLEVCRSIYGFFSNQWEEESESILLDKRNTFYTYDQKCTYLLDFFDRFYDEINEN